MPSNMRQRSAMHSDNDSERSHASTVKGDESDVTVPSTESSERRHRRRLPSASSAAGSAKFRSADDVEFDNISPAAAAHVGSFKSHHRGASFKSHHHGPSFKSQHLGGSHHPYYTNINYNNGYMVPPSPEGTVIDDSNLERKVFKHIEYTFKATAATYMKLLMTHGSCEYSDDSAASVRRHVRRGFFGKVAHQVLVNVACLGLPTVFFIGDLLHNFAHTTDVNRSIYKGWEQEVRMAKAKVNADMEKRRRVRAEMENHYYYVTNNQLFNNGGQPTNGHISNHTR
jgi:hypothetical protein